MCPRDQGHPGELHLWNSEKSTGILDHWKLLSNYELVNETKTARIFQQLASGAVR